MLIIMHCSACFRDPHYPAADDYIFGAKLLPNITMPPRTLKPQGVLGPYQPQIGFSQRERPHRSYNTPELARRMIRWVYRFKCTYRLGYILEVRWDKIYVSIVL